MNTPLGPFSGHDSCVPNSGADEPAGTLRDELRGLRADRLGHWGPRRRNRRMPGDVPSRALTAKQGDVMHRGQNGCWQEKEDGQNDPQSIEPRVTCRLGEEEQGLGEKNM